MPLTHHLTACWRRVSTFLWVRPKSRSDLEVDNNMSLVGPMTGYSGVGIDQIYYTYQITTLPSAGF